MKWREAGLLQPLDTSKIAGWNDLIPGIMAMKDLATTADGKAWFMPWDWGNTLLTYNSEKVDENDVQSLKAFADPKFKDRVSIGDNVDDAYALASLAIGLKDWTQMTDDAVQAGVGLPARGAQERPALLDRQHRDRAGDERRRGRPRLGLERRRRRSRQLAGAPVKIKRDTDEGMSTWVCGYVRLKDAPGNADKAYDYPERGQRSGGRQLPGLGLGLRPANAKGMAAIDPAVLAEKGYDDVDKFVDKTLFQSPVPTELKLKMIAEFEKIKAGY